MTPCARRTAAALAAAAALLTACVPAEDEAGVPTPEPGGDTPADTDAAETVRSAAAATLAQGTARTEMVLTGEDGASLRLASHEHFADDRRRLVPVDAEEELVVDGSEVFVRTDALGEQTWARFDLDVVAEEGTAGTQDLRMLPLTDPAGVLRTLAGGEASARAAGEAGASFHVTVTVATERELAGDLPTWLERYAATGVKEVPLRVELDADGGTVERVAYGIPAAAERGLQQGEQVGGEGEEEEAGPRSGLELSIEYGGGDVEPVEPPEDPDVVEVEASEIVPLLDWLPAAGRLRGD